MTKGPAKEFPFSLTADGKRFYILILRSRMGNGVTILHRIDSATVRQSEWIARFQRAFRRDCKAID